MTIIYYTLNIGEGLHSTLVFSVDLICVILSIIDNQSLQHLLSSVFKNSTKSLISSLDKFNVPRETFSELDEFRNLSKSGKAYLSKVLEKETKITGIDLATAFFGDFGVTEGEIELWVI